MNKIEIITMVGEAEGKFVRYEDYCKLQAAYDELNDFTNSQCRKLLEKIEIMKREKNKKKSSIFN